jgi:hypothetical protein
LDVAGKSEVDVIAKHAILRRIEDEEFAAGTESKSRGNVRLLPEFL